MQVSSSPGGYDLCQPLVPGKGNTGACLHNGWGFVGVLKWHFSVVLGEHRAGNSSWMTHCYSIPWHGLHSASTLMVIAAIFYDLWLISPPSSSSSLSLFLHLLPALLFFFSHSSIYTSTVYLLLRRPQAGDDLWLLADGLAGELLQYCHDHQAGGSGQGRFPFPLSCDLSSRLWRWMEGNVFLELPLSFAIYQKNCCALCCGRKWLPLSDHEWSPFALVSVPQGQSFDVYEGPWRNIVASTNYSCLCWIQQATVEY